MSTGIDIQFVREAYKRMSDQDLIRALTQDSSGLTNEAIEVVKQEIKDRNLDPNICEGVDAQQKTYSIDEIDAYCNIIRKLPCPVTGSTTQKLNATLTAEAVSFLFFTQYSKKIIVCSPDILDKANTRALIKSALLGWWGIPWGIIRTIQAIDINSTNKKTNHIGEPNDFLRSFVLSNIGEIVTYINNKEMLLKIISIN